MATTLTNNKRFTQPIIIPKNYVAIQVKHASTQSPWMQKATLLRVTTRHHQLSVVRRLRPIIVSASRAIFTISDNSEMHHWPIRVLGILPEQQEDQDHGRTKCHLPECLSQRYLSSL